MNRRELFNRLIRYKLVRNLYFSIAKNKISRKIAVDSMARLDCCSFTSSGTGNTITIEKGASLTNCRIIFNGNNNLVCIGANTNLDHNMISLYDDGNILWIGSNVNICMDSRLVLLEGTKMEIGDNCLFSYDIEIRTSDSHSLLDKEGKRQNPARDIFIGNHVWIAQKCLILKGAIIGNDCVVAAGSIVTGHKFANNTLIMGSPARVKRENINWTNKRILP